MNKILRNEQSIFAFTFDLGRETNNRNSNGLFEYDLPLVHDYIKNLNLISMQVVNKGRYECGRWVEVGLAVCRKSL